MTARFRPVTRDATRHADDDYWPRTIHIERRTQEIANDLDAYIKRRYGVGAWSDAMQVLAQEVAEAEMRNNQHSVSLRCAEVP